ncbi:EGT [Chrysodeixis includens nucleopolyhedrovirus]|uniref:Ecdysteroid UDP-glucosyltransferase n=1 Tax=Chrysodeixis includens nucleopolyhedrovirus TaxID=1207438 RepID=A0A5B8YS20_9ABAC|nr:EGT [Chrysodeixis includens nucleopolyhedrovirus]QED40646.1 EGT [Chrysodeixis includens nucleopolyhedrovirus]
MYHIAIFCLTIVIALAYYIEAARILAVFPTPAYSHQSVFRVYIRALAERGHEIYVIKPSTRIAYTDPVADIELRGNITEIDASMSEEYFGKLIKASSVFRKRGVISDASTVTAHNYLNLVRMISDQFELRDVKQFIDHRKEYRFDVLVTEAFIDYPLVFSHLFHNLPVIQISSGYGVAENFETMGAVSRHPIYYPNMWRDKFRDLNVWETINEIYMELSLQNEFSKLADEQDKMLKDQFGADTPSVHELRNRVELLFLNTHAVFDNNRPVPPSVQYLGGLHLVKQNHLQANYATLNGFVKEFLDNSTQGVVYVSFGSGIVTTDMDVEFRDMFLQVFASLPYNVLWKYDDIIPISKLPTNVFTQAWFDQFEVLKHPNVKAFVTQGGVQSTDEAIEALVPVIGLPMMGDQAFNANKYTELGIGRALNTHTVNAKQLIEAIVDVAESSNYRKKLLQLRHFIRHQAISPLQKAIWYTEHVITNKGKTMLKTKAANVSYSDYVMLNLCIPFVTVFVMNHLRQLLRINLF